MKNCLVSIKLSSQHCAIENSRKIWENSPSWENPWVLSEKPSIITIELNIDLLEKAEGEEEENPAVTKEIEKTLYLRNALRQRKMSYTKISGEAPPIQRCMNQNPSFTHPGRK